MHEYERELNVEKTIHNDLRSSSYVSFSFLPNDNVELINTFFYQPLFTYLNDYRILDQFKFSAKAGKRLSLAVNLNYLYDNKPVIGVPKINYTISTGIEYNF